METKSSRKESSFLAELPLIKLVEAANRQSPTKPRKFVALCHRNTKIRMRSDERDYWVFLSVVETIVGWALCCSVGIVIVFSIFCITFLGDCTHPPQQKTIAIR